MISFHCGILRKLDPLHFTGFLLKHSASRTWFQGAYLGGDPTKQNRRSKASEPVELASKANKRYVKEWVNFCGSPSEHSLRNHVKPMSNTSQNFPIGEQEDWSLCSLVEDCLWQHQLPVSSMYLCDCMTFTASKKADQRDTVK